MTRSSLENIKQKQKELTEKREAFEQEAKQVGKATVKDLFMEFFELHKNVEGIRWDQYTQYFNDGNTCNFNVYEPMLRLVNHDEDSSEGMWGTCSWHNQSAVESTAFQAFLSSVWEPLQELGEEFFETTFGDHCEITVTRDGITCEWCEHD